MHSVTANRQKDGHKWRKGIVIAMADHSLLLF